MGAAWLELYFKVLGCQAEQFLKLQKNLREGMNLLIGRPEINAWGIIFTSEGPRPKKVPIELEII